MSNNGTCKRLVKPGLEKSHSTAPLPKTFPEKHFSTARPFRSGTASGGQLFVKSRAKTFYLKGSFIELNFLLGCVFSLYDTVLMVIVKCGDVIPITPLVS